MTTTNQTPRVVVFDLGGVLFEWSPHHLYGKLIGDAAERQRFLTEICPPDWHARQDAGDDPLAATRALQARHPAAADLIGAWYERFDEMLAPPYPEMVALVTRLRDAGIGLHLLSNAPGFMHAWMAHGRLRAAHPFLGAFQSFVVSGDVGVSKPARAIYELAAARGGFTPSEAVFIDDLAANAEGARACGWRAIHHRAPDQTVRDLRAMGLDV